MLNMNEFKLVSARKRRRADACYVTIEGYRDSRRSSIVLSDSVYEELARCFGSTVDVFAAPPAVFAIRAGNGRRLQHRGKSDMHGRITVYPAAEMLAEAFPGARRVYLAGKWDTDERGRSVYLLQPTGEVDRDVPDED